MTFWTETREQELRFLWEQKLSCSQIADRMGGTTRNAVIGKVHRLGLSSRMTDDERSKRRVSRHRKPAFRIFRTVTAREKPEPQAVTRIELANEFIDKSKSVTFANLGPSHCRWGYGDPKRPGFVFCGCEKVTGDPYCEPHMAIAVQPSTKRSAAA